jgi:hypothetical protein
MPTPARPRLRLLRLLLLLSGLAGLFAVPLSGCGGSSFAQGVYDDGTVRYRVGSIGSDWERVQVDENDLAWTHGSLGTISVNSTCSEYEDVPEQALMNHLLFGMRERKFQVEETVTLDGRGALHTVVELELDGVPLTLEILVLKKDGCVYDLSLIASRASFQQARPVFASLVRGFAVLRTSL